VGLEFVSNFPEWDHVQFRVRDADLSIHFFGDYLGMAAVRDQRDSEGRRWVWLRFSENPVAPLFVLVEDSQAKKQAPGPSQPLFCFRLPDLKPVEEIGNKAKKDGCLVEGSNYGGHMRGYFCVVADPDGNLFEFSYLLSPKPGAGQ